MKYRASLISCMVCVSVTFCGITKANAKLTVIQHRPNAPTVRQVGITGGELERLYRSIQSVETTPEGYVTAYMKAVASRDGIFARAYLAPFIRDYVPPRNIGVSNWIEKWTIMQVSQPSTWPRFHVVAYYLSFGPTAEKSIWAKKFEMDLTLSKQDVVYPPHRIPMSFMITDQKITWSNGKVTTGF